LQGVTTLDAKPLTIAISSNVSKLKADESATITFTLSEVSTDFEFINITTDDNCWHFGVNRQEY
jgi:hypothetical protein